MGLFDKFSKKKALEEANNRVDIYYNASCDLVNDSVSKLLKGENPNTDCLIFEVFSYSMFIVACHEPSFMELAANYFSDKIIEMFDKIGNKNASSVYIFYTMNMNDANFIFYQRVRYVLQKGVCPDGKWKNFNELPSNTVFDSYAKTIEEVLTEAINKAYEE